MIIDLPLVVDDCNPQVTAYTCKWNTTFLAEVNFETSIPVWLIMTVCESMPYWFSTNIVMLVQLCDTGSVYCTLPLIGTSCTILSDWLLHILVRTMLKFSSPSKHWTSYVRGKQNISLRTKAGIILPSVILAVNHLHMIHWIYHRLELVGNI